jgi:hypothetical protein
MYKKYGNRRPRKYAKRFGSKRRMAKKTTDIHIKRIVRQALARNLEVKQTVTTNNNMGITSPNSITGVPGANGALNILPTLSQGVSQEGRIGNRVHFKYGHFKGQINLMPNIGTTNPNQQIMVAMYLVKSKLFNQGYTPDWTKFFAAGVTSGQFLNLPTDIFQTVNKDLFTVCSKKVFRLGTTTNSGAAYLGDGRSSVSKYFNFNLTKYLKKNLIFNDSGTTPTNDNLWLLTIPVCLDGSGVDTTAPIEMHFEALYNYTDA